MAEPRTTENPATQSRPERSSKRVARKSPLGWLPWALLGLLALLLALVFLIINAIDDDGPDGPAGDSLGQVSGSDGSGVNGSDGTSGNSGSSGTDTSQGGAAAPTTAPGGGQAPAAGGGQGDLSSLTGASLVGGAGVAVAPASAVPATLAKREAGTAGTVLFAEGSAELDANANKVITTAAQNVKAAGATKVTISGFTDVVAGAQVNDPLSQERADAVAEGGAAWRADHHAGEGPGRAGGLQRRREGPPAEPARLDHCHCLTRLTAPWGRSAPPRPPASCRLSSATARCPLVLA